MRISSTHSQAGRLSVRDLVAAPKVGLVVLVVVSLLLCNVRESAADRDGVVSIPGKQAALLMLRILSYDRALKKRSPEEVRILVLYDKGDKASLADRARVEEGLESVSSIKVSGLPVYSFTRSYRPDKLDEDLAKIRPTAVYVCMGLESEREAISAATSDAKVLTIAGSESYIKAGFSVGLIAGPRRAKLLINLKASRAEGVRFDAGLLRLAEVLK